MAAVSEKTRTTAATESITEMQRVHVMIIIIIIRQKILANVNINFSCFCNLQAFL